MTSPSKTNTRPRPRKTKATLLAALRARLVRLQIVEEVAVWRQHQRRVPFTQCPLVSGQRAIEFKELFIRTKGCGEDRVPTSIRFTAYDLGVFLSVRDKLEP